MTKLDHYPSITQLADGLFMATWNGCNCVFTMAPHTKAGGLDVEIVIVGGRQCENFPSCFFPVEAARIECEIMLDTNAIEPKFELLVPDVTAIDSMYD